MKKLFGFAAVGAAALSLASCGGDEVKIGVVLPTSAEPRWLQDEASFREAANDAGYGIEIVFSDGDSNKEKSNVEALITKGIEVLILGPHDGTAAGSAAQAADDEGITVISYDRLITNTEAVDYYVTFDSVEVGRKQAQYLIDNATGTGNELYLYGGAASDNNAFLFFEGAWEKLQPKIADGTFVIKNSAKANELKDNETLTNTQIGQILDQITTNWDFNTAATLAENNITANAPTKSDVFVLAPNDGTARAIQAKFATASGVSKVYITGQDAEKESIQSIIDGKQSMSVLKDTRVLARTALDMAVEIIEGKTPTTDSTYNNGVKDVPSVQTEIFTITIDNVEEIIFDGGIFNKDDFNNLNNLPA